LNYAEDNGIHSYPLYAVAKAMNLEMDKVLDQKNWWIYAW